jgi:TubC N-terminal docking domain
MGEAHTAGKGPGIKVRALFEELERAGVKLLVVGEDLEYEGPEAAITPVLLEKLKANKADLLATCGSNEPLSQEGPQPAETRHVRGADEREARKLLAARWKPKERCGKIIRESPVNGFYCSQEAAMHFSSRE